MKKRNFFKTLAALLLVPFVPKKAKADTQDSGIVSPTQSGDNDQIYGYIVSNDLTFKPGDVLVRAYKDIKQYAVMNVVQFDPAVELLVLSDLPVAHHRPAAKMVYRVKTLKGTMNDVNKVNDVPGTMWFKVYSLANNGFYFV